MDREDTENFCNQPIARVDNKTYLTKMLTYQPKMELAWLSFPQVEYMTELQSWSINPVMDHISMQKSWPGFFAITCASLVKVFGNIE